MVAEPEQEARVITAAVEAAELRGLTAGRVLRAAERARVARGPLRAAACAVAARGIAIGGERRIARGLGAALTAVAGVAVIDQLPATRRPAAAATA